MNFLKINNISELKKQLQNSKTDFFINLGGLRSSKYITWDGSDKFYVFNEIDGSEDEFTEHELMEESNIGEAITKGCFYMYI